MYKYFMSNPTGLAYKIDNNNNVYKLVGKNWKPSIVLPEKLVGNPIHYTQRNMIHAGRIQHGLDVIGIEYYFINRTHVAYQVGGNTFEAPYSKVDLVYVWHY
tara:strand:+ start:2878 stop:3183 length:306 start_codon:yes stop_codon:yes gene_type:complete